MKSNVVRLHDKNERGDYEVEVFDEHGRRAIILVADEIFDWPEENRTEHPIGLNLVCGDHYR